MKHRGGNIFLSIDWVTVLIYTVLVVLGWINIYSAVYDESHSSILSMSQRYGKQLVWIGIAYGIISIVGLHIPYVFFDFDELACCFIFFVILQGQK